MQIHNLYFSPTGKTKAVADIVAHVLGEHVNEIDLSLHDSAYGDCHFDSDDLCVVTVPSFGGRVPAPALQALGQMPGDKTNAIVIVTYGNRHYDDALLELQNALSKLGFHVIAGIAAVTEHSIVRQFGAGRPDDADRQELLGFADKISAVLGRDVLPRCVDLPGNEPYRKYNGVPLKPATNKKLCTKCGVCAERCPVGAISTVDPRFTDKQACISCMRCITICPRHARKLNKLILRLASRKMEASCEGRKQNLLFFSS